MDQAKKMKGLVTKRVPGGDRSSEQSTTGAETRICLWAERGPEGPLFHGCVRSAASAAYEVDDLKFVAIIEDSVGPAVSRDDVAIQFNGDAVRFHPEHLYESAQCEGSWRVRELPFFAIDVEFHCVCAAALFRPSGAVQVRLASESHGLRRGLYSIAASRLVRR